MTSHDWNVSAKEAIEIQNRLRQEVRLVPLKKEPALIGGADVSMNLYATEGYAGFVVLDRQHLTLQDHAVVKRTIPFPYIPGLLSFREIPMLLEVWNNLKTKPDVVIVDGLGIAHPRRLGIASHLGVLLDIPTIGCAKSVLIGNYKEPGNEPGSFTYLHDPKDPNKIIGAALRTKKNVKPVFISPGHLIILEQSIDIVKQCVLKHRLPEPTRLAHNIVNEYRIKG